MKSFLKVLDKVLEVSCVALLFANVAIVSAQVFWRFALHDPLIWSEEFARLLFTYMTFLAAALTIRRRRSLRITVLVERMRPRARHALDLLTNSLILVFMIIVIVQSKVVIDGIGYHEAPATGIQVAVFYLSLPVAGLAMVVYTLEQMANSIAGIRDGRPVPGGHHHPAADEVEVEAPVSAKAEAPVLAAERS